MLMICLLCEQCNVICRLQTRPTGITLAQLMKHSHPSKPPPPPSFRAPPPPPLGPPPSACQAAARSKGSAVPAPEPRRNAWDQPLAGSRLSQDLSQADSLDTPSTVVHSQSQTGSDQHALKQQESYDAVSSGNADGAIKNSYNAHSAFGVASGQQQEDQEGAVASSPTQSQPEGSSATAATVPSAVEPACTSGQYPMEAQHKAQIADLQASLTAARVLGVEPCIVMSILVCDGALYLCMMHKVVLMDSCLLVREPICCVDQS